MDAEANEHAASVRQRMSGTLFLLIKRLNFFNNLYFQICSVRSIGFTTTFPLLRSTAAAVYMEFFRFLFFCTVYFLFFLPVRHINEPRKYFTILLLYTGELSCPTTRRVAMFVAHHSSDASSRFFLGPRF